MSELHTIEPEAFHTLDARGRIALANTRHAVIDAELDQRRAAERRAEIKADSRARALAMPRCAAPDCKRFAHGRWCAQHFIDPVAVERLVAGDPPANTTAGERAQAVRVLVAQGATDRIAAARMGITVAAVSKIRAKHGIAPRAVA